MRKSAFLLSFLLLFAAGCTPIEDYPLEIKAEMVGGLRPAYYFDVNAEGLLTVEVWRSEEEGMVGPEKKQLDEKTILQLKKLLKKASRNRGKEPERIILDHATVYFTANGEEYPGFIAASGREYSGFTYGIANDKSLDEIMTILIEQSPIPVIDFAGNPIKPIQLP